MDMSYDFALDASKSDLENKVKVRYEPGPIRHRLYEIFEEAGQPVARQKFAWMYYAGMGDVDLYDANKKDVPAIQTLLKDGILVPTFEEDFYGVKNIRRLMHFDDVNFGLEKNGGIVIFELVKWLSTPDMPDLVIRPDEKYDAVISKLKGRMESSLPSHNALVDETPLQLKGGPLVHPIITDPNRVRVMMRQRGLDV